jgi:hypothetical protein
MSSDARTAIEQTVATWPAAARERVLGALDRMGPDPLLDTPPEPTDADVERGRAAAQTIRAASDADAPGADPELLMVLSPDEAAELVAAIATSGDARMLMTVVRVTDPRRFPVGQLLRVAATQPPGAEAREALVRAAALTSMTRLERGIADLTAAADADVADLVAEVADARAQLAAGPPYRWWRESEMSMAEPPSDGQEPVGDEELPEPAPPLDPTPGGEPVLRGDDDAKSYPRLDVESRTDRPDVVVVDQPFTVTVGLQARRSRETQDTGAVSLPTDSNVTLQATLLFDPESIEVVSGADGATPTSRADLSVTPLARFPEARFDCVAKYGENLAAERRIGLQLMLGGEVVAVAWRTVVAADSADRVADAVAPQPPGRLLGLASLVGGQPPDLVVSVTRSDVGADSYVWSAYTSMDAVSVPDLPSTTRLEKADADAFATEIRRMFLERDAGSPLGRWLELAGRARRVGEAIPEGIREAIAATVQHSGSTAPAILLLTEEVDVPWELAWFDELASVVPDAEKTAPFLGAHAAISRWPLSDDERPDPTPAPAVVVSGAAVLTADYTGVPTFPVLESALAEAAEVSGLFEPRAVEVVPELASVIALFKGDPPSKLVHAAVHGKFDNEGNQQGIVLLEKSPAGGAVGRYLTPTMLENGRLDGPFVFLNACQVGSDEQVLGNYGGFATTLVKVGAAAVVAPLWNVRDTVAAEFARRFYANAWGTATSGGNVSVAEAVRQLRALYTQDAVSGGDQTADPTVISYQVLGHPRLRLNHEN